MRSTLATPGLIVCSWPRNTARPKADTIGCAAEKLKWLQNRSVAAGRRKKADRYWCAPSVGAMQGTQQLTRGRSGGLKLDQAALPDNCRRLIFRFQFLVLGQANCSEMV